MRFNCILRFSYANDIEAHLDSLIGKAPSNVPIAFWMDQKDSTPELIQALKNRNFVSAGFYPAMSWDVTSVEAPELEVQPADIELFHEILATCLHYNEGVKQGSLNLLRDKGGEHFIVYLEGKPVGTGTLFAKGEIGAVFHVATLPEYQKRGVGRAMMQFIMNKASEKGLKKLVLHSSHVAEKLYHSLGFQKIDDVEIYYREP
jgi:ribosomal protein S18 acetylase RimI-like enzyme